MTNKYTLQTRFIVPDDLDEGNVRHVLGQFLNDLTKTDRFIEAEIVEQTSLDRDEQRRLLQMLDYLDDGDMESLEEIIESSKDDQNN